jgi:phosphoglycolate phosphatase-like HAD superfamily hydrolase
MKFSRFFNPFVFVLVLFSFSACGPEPAQNAPDPLPSWNEGETKSAIKNFVGEVTDPQSGDYIDIPDRVAVFDNDGNLWSEQPVYFQLFFAMDRVKALAPVHPEWSNEQPFQAVLEGDMDALGSQGVQGILELVMATHSGYTTDEFEGMVKDWLSTARHPRFNRPYTDLVYQPMLELLDFLRQNGFRTYIVSGGGIDFMRPWVEQVYGIPREQVVGSSIRTVFAYREGIPVIIRMPEIEFINDKEGKPLGINRFIGRKPVFVSGNSDGDLAMMQWTASGEGKRFMLYLHHTDADREWAYDRNSSVGRLDKGLDEALEKGWTVIDMKRDWKVIYPFELEK